MTNSTSFPDTDGNDGNTVVALVCLKCLVQCGNKLQVVSRQITACVTCVQEGAKLVFIL